MLPVSSTACTVLCVSTDAALQPLILSYLYICSLPKPRSPCLCVSRLVGRGPFARLIVLKCELVNFAVVFDKVSREPLLHVGRQLVKVPLVFSWEDDVAHATPPCRNRFLLYSPDRKNAPCQGDLPGHCQVWPDWPARGISGELSPINTRSSEWEPDTCHVELALVENCTSAQDATSSSCVVRLFSHLR